MISDDAASAPHPSATTNCSVRSIDAGVTHEHTLHVSRATRVVATCIGVARTTADAAPSARSVPRVCRPASGDTDTLAGTMPSDESASPTLDEMPLEWEQVIGAGS